MNDWMKERSPDQGTRSFVSSCGSLPVAGAKNLRNELARNSAPGVVVPLVAEMYLNGSWGKGKLSWGGFLESERLQVRGLSQAGREPFVRGLHACGLSQRAIAPFLGVSHQTVKNDCARLNISGPVIGVNGKSYAPLPKWHLSSKATSESAEMRAAA